MFVNRKSVAMANTPDKLFDDTCWVYVQLEDDGAYTIGITYDGGFRLREMASGRPPLLWRRFEDTLLAAGYRIALKGLSPESLRRILRWETNGKSTLKPKHNR